MKDFWAVVGLAVVDEPFRAQLLRVKDDGEGLTHFLNREHCFHLSRFEIREIQDFFGHSKVIRCMEEMHEAWRPKSCEVSRTFDPRYVHVKPSPEVIRAIRRLKEKSHESPITREQEREDQALVEYLRAFQEGGDH